MTFDTDQLHVVVGATGGTGSATLRTLACAGLRVRAVARSLPQGLPAGVEAAPADALDLARMCEVCKGAAVVYNCVNPPFTQWHALFPRVMNNLIVAAARADAVLVFADDTWMYGPPTGPLTEEHPQRPAGVLGALRAQLAATLLEAHRQRSVRAAIGRASELYGPGVESMLGANLFESAIRGRRMFWPGSLGSPLNPTYIDDFARGLMTLGTRDEALGQVWHMPTAAPITGREFVQLLVAEAGTQSPRDCPEPGAGANACPGVAGSPAGCRADLLVRCAVRRGCREVSACFRCEADSLSRGYQRLLKWPIWCFPRSTT